MRTRVTALVVLFFSSTGLVPAQYTAEYGRRQRAFADLRSHQNAVLLIHANSQTNRVEGGFRQDHSFTTSLGLKILSERCSRSTAILAIAGYSCRLTRLSSPLDDGLWEEWKNDKAVLAHIRMGKRGKGTRSPGVFTRLERS
jgi:hypothetical protein